ncbi:hypothetical protein ACQKAE_03540 [Helicobacter pylori]
MQKTFQNRLAFFSLLIKECDQFKACLSLSDKPIQSHYSVKYP